MEVTVTGDKELFEVLYRVVTASYTREATAMCIRDVGCVVNTKTIMKNHDGTLAIAESSCFVPNVMIVTDGNGNRLEEI